MLPWPSCWDDAPRAHAGGEGRRGGAMAEHAERDELFRKLLKKPGNRRCFDCPAPGPKWATVPFAVLLCLDCAGAHRQLGVHVTKVGG